MQVSYNVKWSIVTRIQVVPGDIILCLRRHKVCERFYYEEAWSFYTGRAIGSNSDYCSTHVNIDTGAVTSEEASQGGSLPVKFEAMEPCLPDVYE